MTWSCKSFTELTNEELYKILQLRMEVFVLEQHSVYQDCDNKDQQSYHYMGWQGDKLVAYTRLLPPGIAYTNSSIGRVVTSPLVRGNKIGRELMKRSIDKTIELFGETPVTIGAQLYLKKFYESLGFIKTSDIYLEDGIEHIKMQFN